MLQKLKIKSNIIFPLYFANYANLERKVKKMEWCPLTKEDCKKSCAWFREDECAIAVLHDIFNTLDFVQDGVNALQETIESKDFTQ